MPSNIRPTRRSALAAICGSVFPASPAVPGPTQLKVSANRRYLEDATGTPFFLVGDSPQNMPVKLSIAELDPYMDEAAASGFTLLWICIDGQRGEGPKYSEPGPIDRAGRPMMTSAWDIGTLNPDYFQTIDAILQAAAARRMYCMLTPLSECEWSQEHIDRNSAEKWHQFGIFLGGRYAHTGNIIWQFGNDHITEAAQHAIVRGIKQAGDTHLMTVNWRAKRHQQGSGWVRRFEHNEDWIDLNAWYNNTPVLEGGAPCYWQKVEYERASPLPAFLTEAQYQQPFSDASDLVCRMQHYYVALGGGCGGCVYGSGWLCDDVDYRTYRDHGGRRQAVHFRNLFAPRAWHTLAPDYSHRFVTRGYGTLSPTTMDYVGAAMNDGALGIAYCPQLSAITVDLSRFRAPVTARWYDPTDGTMSSPGAELANRGTRQFQASGKNQAGDPDWVLLLETHPRSG